MAKKLASSQVTITDMTDVTEAANTAKTTAEATAKHFWSDTDGAHVTHTEAGETIAGCNVLVSTDGFSVRDGETTLASFGKELIQIGKDGGQNVQISPTAVTLSGGLVNKMQAGYVNITPGSSTVTYNGVKYYEGTATVTFDPAFDSVPSISLTPSTAVPYKMALGASKVSKTGFTIEFFRDSQTGAGIHWTAMPRTQ